MSSSFSEARLASVFRTHYQWPDEPGNSVPQAAVAAVFRSGPKGTELLFIQRATRETDPWSGQMAFPGGRRQSEDETPSATAERETLEEVGLDLTVASPLGTFTVLDGGRATNRPIIVSAHGFWLPGPTPELAPNYEVADTIWVPIDDLLNRSRTIDYYFAPADQKFPGIQLDNDDQVVWGLTLRMLADLFSLLEEPFII